MIATMPYSDVKSALDRVLEQVLKTATPIQFEFKGQRLAIMLVESPSKLSRLERHPDCLVGDPEEIVHLDWSGEVHHDLP